ncbi:hypothetical protein [Rhodoblastus sp.]|uniref:hypothetical protein n=1 Tax=Rhodoblastus sp. TaxID=1962975 RepID=UPI0025F88611|nr:hypothetical protein [Rhodoblastus sp.]
MRTRVAHGFEAFLETVEFILQDARAATTAAANTLPGAIHLPLKLLDTARSNVLQYRRKGNFRFSSQTWFCRFPLNRKCEQDLNKRANYAAQRNPEMHDLLRENSVKRLKAAGKSGHAATPRNGTKPTTIPPLRPKS